MKISFTPYAIGLSFVLLFQFNRLHAQFKSDPDSLLQQYQESSAIKDSCIFFLVEMLDTMNITYKNLATYRKIIKTLSSDLSNPLVANFYLKNMNNYVPSENDWDDEGLEEWPYTLALVNQPLWGMIKNLIDYLSYPRKKEDLYIPMAIIQNAKSGTIPESILDMFQFYGNNEVAKNVETIRSLNK